MIGGEEGRVTSKKKKLKDDNGFIWGEKVVTIDTPSLLPAVGPIPLL